MICVDACLVVRVVTDEEGCEKAIALFESWRKKGIPLVAPALIDYEVSAALCRKVHLGDLKQSEAVQAYRLSQELKITKKHDGQWSEKALLMVRSFEQRTPYDFTYLVMAQELEIELYTTDKKFVDLVKTGYPFVKHYI